MSGFVDEAQLHAKAGDGGMGCMSYRREAHVPRGGPDGGDGGKGGDVWLVADPNVSSLLAFRDHPHRRATKGVSGMGKKRHGHRGVDTVAAVPIGTVVKDANGGIVADLSHAGARWRAARGGDGGRGNARFLTNRRRAPSFAERGEEGEEVWYDLELKLMADVALVGFPNVGKSTLISRISAAKPRIADYPFTTLEPNLGVVRVEDRDFVVADIPGLIEGASDGKGLGHQFLRHIERASVVALLVDLAADAEAPPAEQERVLLRELERYRPDLVTRPRVLVGARADLADPETVTAFESDAREAAVASERAAVEADEDDHAAHPGVGAVVVSSVTGLGLPTLVGRFADLVDQARDAVDEVVDGAFVVHHPAPENIAVERIDAHTWQVVGRPAERAVALSDVSNPDALAYIHHRLKSLGVDRALVRAGVADGDTVTIGDFGFDYQVDE
jgi:GTP-binding protein